MGKFISTLLIVFSLFFRFAAQAATHEVKMLNNGKDGVMVFEPAFLKANKGDSVKFVPTDAGHDVASVEIPKGAKSWQASTGKSITVKLTQEGVYLYVCKAHVNMAMTGVIQVGGAKNLAAVQSKAKELSGQFVMNKDRLDKVFAQIK